MEEALLYRGEVITDAIVCVANKVAYKHFNERDIWSGWWWLGVVLVYFL